MHGVATGPGFCGATTAVLSILGWRALVATNQSYLEQQMFPIGRKVCFVSRDVMVLER